VTRRIFTNRIGHSRERRKETGATVWAKGRRPERGCNDRRQIQRREQLRQSTFFGMPGVYTRNSGDLNDNTSKEWFTSCDINLENRIAGNKTADAAILEFDVFSVNGQLEMEFQFGSEEYDEYVFDTAAPDCYNDAFMITIDDKVLSLLPDCSDIVAVNSVHSFIPANISCTGNEIPALDEHLYLDDDLDILPTLLPESWVNQVDSDGMTIRLRIHAFVEPNTSHRIKIAIADVEDSRWDSTLFVKEGSVRSVVPTQ